MARFGLSQKSCDNFGPYGGMERHFSCLQVQILLGASKFGERSRK